MSIVINDFNTYTPIKNITFENNNFKIISIGIFLSFSIKNFTIPYTPKYKMNGSILSNGIMKNPITEDAKYTKTPSFTSLRIIAIAGNIDEIVKIAKVFIGISKLKYKVIIVSATNIPPSAIFLDLELFINNHLHKKLTTTY